MHDATVPTGTPDAEAKTLLSRHWATPEGDYPVPVDPIYLARQLGMEVYLSDPNPRVAARHGW